MSDSLISCDIDLDAMGKRTGFLRVPHSTHRSAYGWLPVPITVIVQGQGPTLLLLAGVHGDEYEGQIALSKLARDLEPEAIQGRVIIVAAVNAPAAEAGQRVSPLDHGNLNRAFPGNPCGTVTEMIAHYLETVLIPQCDVMVDLHSGGTSLLYPPTLLRGQGQTKEEAARLAALQEAFDLPYAWLFTSGGGRNSTARTAMGAANRAGVVSVMAELGGGGAVCRDALALTERGLRRILHSLGMLPGYVPDAARGTRDLHAQGLVYAMNAGVFEPLVDIGDNVEAGDPVGVIHAVHSHACAPVTVVSPYGGMVLCKRALAQVRCGDALYQIARDAE